MVFKERGKPEYPEKNLSEQRSAILAPPMMMMMIMWYCVASGRYFRYPCPGIVNRTFENRTQSNSIELNPWIEFDWVRQSNDIEHHTFSEFDFRTNRIQSNKSNSIELNPSDCVRLSSETELNRTQLNGFRSRDYIGWLSFHWLYSESKCRPQLRSFLWL